MVGQYGRHKGQIRFVVWLYKDAFEAGKKCVDGVCGACKIDHNGNGHRWPICKESIVDYRQETNARYMPRKRPNWNGPGPTNCAICDIVL